MRLWTAVKMTFALTLLTGIIYPVLITVVSETIFPFQAQGSLIARDGHIVGSALIGQNFSAPGYFHPRPSAAGDKGYDSTSSSGSNLGPTNKTLIDTGRQRLKETLEQNPGARRPMCRSARSRHRAADLTRRSVRPERKCRCPGWPRRAA